MARAVTELDLYAAADPMRLLWRADTATYMGVSWPVVRATLGGLALSVQSDGPGRWEWRVAGEGWCAVADGVRGETSEAAQRAAEAYAARAVAHGPARSVGVLLVRYPDRSDAL